MAGKKIRLAIFDIDGTIFRSSLIIEVFNALIAAAIFPKTANDSVKKNYLRWLDRKGHYNDYLMKLVRAYYRYLPGLKTSVIDPVIQQVITKQKDRVYRYTRDLLHALSNQGYHMVAISNSQHVMVEPFARAQGFDAAIGREPEIVNGCYTGRVLFDGARFPVKAHLDKVTILNDYLRRSGLTADLRYSVAVGDSEGDIPLLEAVGQPIAFNPSKPLAEHARRKKWKIVVERKDVIYEVRDARFIKHNEHQEVSIPYGKKKVVK
jgi:HAD superfamily hydrolase (TIGR01490 family)